MIVCNLRASNGGGKSYAVRQLLEHFEYEPLQFPNGKIKGYVLDSRPNTTFVVGPYETPCGGCDALPNFATIKEVVREAVSNHNVVFEGLLWATVFKTSNEFAQELKDAGHHTIFALMDTTAEKCVEQTRARRLAKGNAKPFDPTQLLAKYAAIARTQDQLKAAGWDTRLLQGSNPLPQLLEWLAGA